MKRGGKLKVILIRGRAIDPSANKIAEALAQNGHEVTLVVWDRQRTLDDAAGRGYLIRRFTLKAPYDKPIALLLIPLWWIYQLRFLLGTQCDVIHACDLDTLIPAMLAKLVKRVNLCYTIYDFYANNLPDGRFQLLRNLVRRIVASVEKFAIGFTDILFLVDESRVEQVQGARIRKLVYTYNSPADYFAGGRRLETKPTSATSAVTLFYAGAIHESRGIRYVVKAVEGMQDVSLVIAGIGPERKLVEDACRRCERIRYLGQIPYREVIERTAAADILFAFYDTRIPTNRYASPNKLFEAMMCAKPIIVSNGSTMTRIVRQENCGLIAPYGDTEAIKAAILELKNNPELRQRLGQNGRMAYEKKYSWEIMAGRLTSAYREMAEQQSRTHPKLGANSKGVE